MSTAVGALKSEALADFFMKLLAKAFHNHTHTPHSSQDGTALECLEFQDCSMSRPEETACWFSMMNVMTRLTGKPH